MKNGRSKCNTSYEKYIFLLQKPQKSLSNLDIPTLCSRGKAKHNMRKSLNSNQNVGFE